ARWGGRGRICRSEVETSPAHPGVAARGRPPRWGTSRWVVARPDRLAQKGIGGGGVAVRLTGLPGPDMTLVRTGPKIPHPAKGGTATVVLIAIPSVSALTGELMLTGSWIRFIV